MLACHVWLAADFLVRAGFLLVVGPDGSRWAVRDGLRFEIDPECGCGYDVCPPHDANLRCNSAA